MGVRPLPCKPFTRPKTNHVVPKPVDQKYLRQRKVQYTSGSADDTGSSIDPSYDCHRLYGMVITGIPDSVMT